MNHLAIGIMVALLSLLLSTQVAGWTNQWDVHTDSKGLYIRAFYTDPSTGIHHLFWAINNFTSALGYKRFYGNGKVIDSRNFSFPALPFFSLGKLQGAGNGKDLYVLAVGDRPCTNSPVIYRCNEPYFSESHDGGNTWSNFVRIQRNDMDDQCKRDAYSFVLVPESQRVLLIYALRCGSSYQPPVEPDKICMVTKPSSSVQFNQERVIYTPGSEHLRGSPLTEFTAVAGKGLIHIFWSEGSEDDEAALLYSISENYGITWSAPRQLYRPIYYDAPLLSSVAESAKVFPQGLIVVSFLETIKSVSLLVSRDNGATFSVFSVSRTFQELVHAFFGVNEVKVCGTSEKPTLFVLTENSLMHMEYSVWDLKSMSSTRPGAPFRYYRVGTGIALSCYNSDQSQPHDGVGKTDIIVTALHAAGSGGKSRIQVTEDIV